ncbi:kinase-like domain-containing protein [Gigaspora rosea]|uniref:Kinase-like domain-containing protein n=1 Tax=Gigaspora rosea TaxID=44941 RepID=A0A397TZZ5_9GLOM|nr:kinase-like domain-containing protein [Gigaspora rosea]
MLSKKCVKKFWRKVKQKCGKDDDRNVRVKEKITENEDNSQVIETLIKKDDRNSEAIEKIKDKQNPLRYNEWIKMKLNKGEIKNFNYYEFHDIKEIGRGSYSDVYTAKYHGERIAFKKFSKLKYKILVNEIKQHIIVNHHDNVIKFLGIITGPETSHNNYMLVLQYADSGNLKDHLQRKTHEGVFKIFWTELIEIAEQIIFGLQHLHDNKIVHRNLHPKNILINNGNILISGFGSAWKFDDSLISPFEEGVTFEYSDPQIFIQSQFIPNAKSDIYSLGVILWELTSGIRPFSKVPNKLFLIHLISKGKRETLVPGTPSKYAKLYKKCWSTDPEKRPKLKKILEILHKIKQSNDIKTIESHIF